MTNSNSTSTNPGFDLDKSLMDLETPIEPLHKCKDRASDASWLIDGIVPEDNVTVLSGARGGFKTYLAWGLAVCVAIGEPFIGRETMRRDVLVFDNENPENVIKRRAEQLGAPDRFYLWSRNMHKDNPPPRIDSRGGLEKYLHLIEKHQPKPLLIFDTLSKFHNKDGNNNKDMLNVMSLFMKLRDAGSTIILLHHCSLVMDGGRPIKSKGAIAVEEDADNVYLLHKTGKGQLAVYGEKCRLEEVYKLQLRLTGNSNFMFWRDVGGTEDDE